MDNLRQFKVFFSVSILVTIGIPIGLKVFDSFFSNHKKIEELLFIVFLIFLLYTLTAGILLYFGRKRNESIVNSFFSLSEWTRKNDIGSATNIIESLSNNDKMKVFFSETQTDIKEQVKVQKRITPLINKNKYLISEIPNIIDAIDDATKDNLLVIKKFVEFENPKTILWENMIKGIINLGTIGLLISGINYAINNYFLKDKVELGILIIAGLFFILTVCLLSWFIAYKKSIREKNAKNFLFFVFKILEEEEGERNS